jgi:starch synthase (maltosyl-transferring)
VPVPVSLVITDLDIGGAERALMALATGLDRRRWRPTVINLSRPGALVDPLRSAGVTVESLDARRRKPLQAITKLARALRRSKPRLVQSFLFHANVASKLAAPLAGHPWVVGGLRVAERRQGWHLKADRLTSPLATGSVCVSEGVRRFSLEVARLDPARLVVIPNGVDPSPIDQATAIDRAGLGIPSDSFLTLYVGRLDPQKGLSFLLEAASKVCQARPDWHLALAGDGPLRESLPAQAETFASLSGRVHWLGRRDDVPALLKAADLVVLPSLWEGMPNVVLEAMAAGKAVVGTSVEGTEDLVLPEQTGWLVPPRESNPLAQALLEATADPARLNRFGENARIRVEAEFTPRQVVKAYENLWAGILGLELDA